MRGKKLFEEVGRRKSVFIAHWDTDGVASVVKLWRFFGRRIRFYTPPIGLYDIPIDELRSFSDYDYVVILDMAIPSDTVGYLARMVDGDVIVLDHHYHPMKSAAIYIDYDMPGGGNFYSNTLLIDDFLGLEHDLLSVLGLVGDYYTRVRELDVYRLVLDVGRKYGIGFDEIYRLTLLIDANHLVNDREAVYRAAEVLDEYLDSVDELLNYSEWVDRYRAVMGEIESIASDAVPSEDDILFHRFSSKYYIISKVGRRLTELYRDKTVVLHNTGFNDVYDQLYIRLSGSGDLLPLIREGIRRGYICGGKSNVAGFLIPKPEADGFINYALGWLRKIS